MSARAGAAAVMTREEKEKKLAAALAAQGGGDAKDAGGKAQPGGKAAPATAKKEEHPKASAAAAAAKKEVILDVPDCFRCKLVFHSLCREIVCSHLFELAFIKGRFVKCITVCCEICVLTQACHDVSVFSLLVLKLVTSVAVSVGCG